MNQTDLEFEIELSEYLCWKNIYLKKLLEYKIQNVYK